MTSRCRTMGQIITDDEAEAGIFTDANPAWVEYCRKRREAAARMMETNQHGT